MGVEVYVQSLENGMLERLSGGHAMSLFGLPETSPAAEPIRLFSDTPDQCDVVFHLADGRLDRLTVWRPTTHPLLWRGLAALLRDGPYVLFMPGGTAPAVGRPEHLTLLPDGIAEALGEPFLARDGEELSDRLVGQPGG